jgi:hypothetical protein
LPRFSSLGKGSGFQGQGQIHAKVSTGIKAVEVTIETDANHRVHGIVAREWMERHWTVGPDQKDLLATFEAHRDEICGALLRRAKASNRNIITLT